MEKKKQERIFGTDGVRGRAGEGWLAPAAVAAIGRAAGDVLGAKSAGTRRPQALVGHDGRRSGPELEAALASGLASRSFEVKSVGLITTPGLALLTRLEEFRLGAMLSASHNPAEDNGIKLFSENGEKLSDETELEIEKRLLRAPTEATPPASAGARAPASHASPPHDESLEATYFSYLVEQAAAGLRLDGLSIVVDCANGGGSRVAPRVFGRLGAVVRAIAADPDGDNINLRCGATHPEALQEEVRGQSAHLGLALDGDGDRSILVDERGELVDGDAILAILGRHAMQRGDLPDPRIVATVMSNRGLHKALREVGVGVVTVDVGDRRVVEALRREKLRLGGEQSGHVVFGPDHFYIGDGIYTALRVLRVLSETQRPLSELASVYRPFPQVLLNVRVAQKPPLADVPRLARARSKVEEELGEDGRVLLRYSGTEPLVRVMVEGPDLPRIQSQAQELADLIAAEIGS